MFMTVEIISYIYKIKNEATRKRTEYEMIVIRDSIMTKRLISFIYVKHNTLIENPFCPQQNLKGWWELYWDTNFEEDK